MRAGQVVYVKLSRVRRGQISCAMLSSRTLHLDQHTNCTNKKAAFHPPHILLPSIFDQVLVSNSVSTLCSSTISELVGCRLSTLSLPTYRKAAGVTTLLVKYKTILARLSQRLLCRRWTRSTCDYSRSVREWHNNNSSARHFTFAETTRARTSICLSLNSSQTTSKHRIHE